MHWVKICTYCLAKLAPRGLEALKGGLNRSPPNFNLSSEVEDSNDYMPIIRNFHNIKYLFHLSNPFLRELRIFLAFVCSGISFYNSIK